MPFWGYFVLPYLSVINRSALQGESVTGVDVVALIFLLSFNLVVMEALLAILPLPFLLCEIRLQQ